MPNIHRLQIEQDDVIDQLYAHRQLPGTNQLTTMLQLEEAIRQVLQIQRNTQNGRNKWIGEGIECRILQASGNTQGWQKGRIRINIEFIPDEVASIDETVDQDSPLNSLR